MILTNYFYKYATKDCGDRIAIPEIDRVGYMTPQYTEMFRNELSAIQLDGTVAILYVVGVTIHQSETRTCTKDYTNSLQIEDSSMVAKSTVGYMLHKYAGLIGRSNNVVSVDMVTNTCASSLYAVKRAEELLKGVDHVVVIAEEKTSFDTIRIFHEHNIPVKPSDAFACTVFSNEGKGTIIDTCKAVYKYSRNPFDVLESGLEAIKTEADVYKVHGTGTGVNNKAEEAVFGESTVEYKSKVGHAQGASGLVELCMAIDDDKLQGDILCIAAGMGGYYASCLLHK